MDHGLFGGCSMTLQLLGTQLVFPDNGYYSNGNGIATAAPNQLTLDAAGKKAASIFDPPLAGVFDAVQFRVNTKTTNGDVDVRVETVDPTSGDPTGTLVSAGANVTVTITAANSILTATFTTPPTLAPGTPVAVVIVNTTGSYTITESSVIMGTPYPDYYNNVSWAHQNAGVMLNISIGGSYISLPGAWNCSGTITSTFNSGSAGFDELGIKFSLPFGFRLIGFKAYVDNDNDAQIVVYDASNSVLATLTLLKGIRQGASSYAQFVYLTTPLTIAANTVYRVTYKPTTTSNIVVAVQTFSAAAVRAAMPGGANFVQTQRVDAGAFTETTTNQTQLGLVIDAIDVPVGGLLLPNGFDGGLVA